MYKKIQIIMDFDRSDKYVIFYEYVWVCFLCLTSWWYSLLKKRIWLVGSRYFIERSES